MKKFLLWMVTLSFAISGCASSPDSLKRASAGSIGGDYMPSDIEVKDINRSAMNVDWRAVTIDGKIYRCSADDMVRRVNCKQVKL